jgi:hypothetical protein
MEHFIGSWILEDLTVCDSIIDHFNNSPNKTPGISYKSIAQHYTVDKNIKDSIDVTIPIDSQISRLYTLELVKVINKYIEKFSFCSWGTEWGLLEEINIQHYPINGGFKEWHCERSNSQYPSTARHLAFMTYLNDVPEGGETEFFYQKIKVKPVKGLTLIWPADWTHTHRGIPSATSEKYIITGWLSFLDQA